MRRVDRSPVAEPSILRKPRPSDGKSELQLATEHMERIATGEKLGAFDFARYKEASVKTALEKLFHGKCAYCESFYAGLQPVDVEHYRPKGEVEGGDWYVVPSLPPDAFRADPSTLWREVMRRQPGELAWHVNRPADPELN